MIEVNNDIISLIKENNLDGLKEFISITDVDLSKPLHSGLTPLMYAILYSDSWDIVRLLAKSEDSFFEKDFYNNSLLHLVTKAGNIEFVQILIDKDLDVNALNDNLETPLQYACFWSDYEMVKILTDNGANINHIGSDGKRVFDWASNYSSFQIINFLLNQNVDLSDHEELDLENIEFSTITRRELKKINDIISDLDMLEIYIRYDGFDEAITVIEKIVEVYPKVYQIQVLLGLLLIKEGRYTEALTTLGFIYNSYPELKEILFYISYCLIKLDKFSDAEIYLKELLVNFPISLRGLGLNSTLYELLDSNFTNRTFIIDEVINDFFNNEAIFTQYKECKRSLQHLYTVKTTDSVDNIISSADERISKNDYHGAVLLLKKYICIDPDNYSLNYALANAYGYVDDYKNEERFLRSGIVILPDWEECWLGLGLNLYCQNNTLGCIEVWEKSIEKFGLLDPNVCEDLAECYYKTHQYDKALDLGLKAIEQFENLMSIYEVIGKVYILKRDGDKALHYLQIYLNLLEMDDESTYEDDELKDYLLGKQFSRIDELYTVIAELFGSGWKYHLKEDEVSKLITKLETRIEEYVENNDLGNIAQNWIDFVFERKTYDYNYFFNLVQSLWELDLKDEYFKVFEVGIPSRFEECGIYSSIALKCFEDCNYEKALKYYLRALELKPESKLTYTFIKPYEANTKYYFIALCYRELNQSDNAITFWKRAIELDYSEDDYLCDKPIDFYSYLAFDLERAGRINEAEKAYKKSLFIKPDSTDDLE